MSTRSVQDFLDQDYSLSVTYLASGKTVSFSGYIDSFKDTFKQNWTADEVYGRMDAVQYYKNTTRNLSWTLDVPSDSESEAVSNFKKLQTLITFSYPTYERGISTSAQTNEELKEKIKQPNFNPDTLNGGNAFLMYQPPLIGVKFSNLITDSGLGSKLVGKFDEIAYEMDKELGFFHVNGNLIPKYFKIQFNMAAIHSGPLGWEKDSSGRPVLRDTKFNGKFPYNI